ncbi:NAD(P)-binding protein [Trichocladium antarcticum]|uniref:NAD(P)-binding protein n=1 Tax=Trichocladium antarcticum TaxID=1450529 RepID=A0AAN6UPS1_9PEZI|nr:NAD(P)-binding protein [Trichocladium antarcticum]
MATFPTGDDAWNAMDMINQSPPVDCTKPYDTSTLAGKTILITGGASGFGAAFARHWALHGAHIMIGDVNDRAGEELVAELRASAPSSTQVFHYQHCDVTSWADQVALFQAALTSSPTGGIDAVVAGAGIVENGSSGRVFDTPRSLDPDNKLQPPPPPPLKVLAVNLTGVMYTTHLALHYLKQNAPPPGRRDRHILLISSVAGVMGLPGQTEYTASKHAVMGLFRAMRATAWAEGVRVNLLAPYFVDTPLLPTAGMLLLAGGAKGEVRDVVDAGTRLMADEGVRGRALCIGPGLKMEEEREEQVVWEIYAHDYARVEVFVWRYLKLLNVAHGVRGWVGLVKDLWGVFVTRRTR